MAYFMCPVCGEGVSSGDKHKCKPVPFNMHNKIMNFLDEKKDEPFFKGYKTKFYFKTDKD